MVICPSEELYSSDKLPDFQTDKLDDKFETNNENIIKLVKGV